MSRELRMPYNDLPDLDIAQDGLFRDILQLHYDNGDCATLSILIHNWGMAGFERALRMDSDPSLYAELRFAHPDLESACSFLFRNLAQLMPFSQAYYFALMSMMEAAYDVGMSESIGTSNKYSESDDVNDNAVVSWHLERNSQKYKARVQYLENELLSARNLYDHWESKRQRVEDLCEEYNGQKVLYATRLTPRNMEYIDVCTMPFGKYSAHLVQEADGYHVSFTKDWPNSRRGKPDVTKLTRDEGVQLCKDWVTLKGEAE